MVVRRVLRWGAVVVASALLAVAVLGGWYIHAIEPQISGPLRLPGLTAPVDVVRDKNGVPHIYATDEADALFAQGVVHAQDRLWQMEMQRRLANGRLAEILGPAAINIDIMLRTLGIRRTAEAMWASYSASERAPFEAYARGVNAVLTTRRSPLPPEFLITGAPTPEPWSGVDSIGWTLMMAWDLGSTWRQQLLRTALLQHGLSQKQISQFLPAYPGDHYPPLGDVKQLYGKLFKELHADAGNALDKLSAVPGFVEGMGSNNWVVAGERSATGKPLLANDPHLGLGAPSLWYLTHLATADGLNVIGASLPGVPGIVLGRNGRIAWGFTNTGPAVQDLYFEKINPDNSSQYQTPEGWREFGVVVENVRVKGAPDRVLRIRSTRHGPVVSDVRATSIVSATPPGHVIAFAWTALSPANRTPLVAGRLARAGNWDDFVAALRDFEAPEQNIVYADVDGNIGFIAPGKVPIRKPENDLKGLFPAPGWDAKYDWAGFIPFEELPRALNPADGFFASANQKIVGPEYPYSITYQWPPPYRYDRIVELIQATPKHTLSTFAAMQGDVTSLALRQALPHLLAAPPAGLKEQAAHDLLARWPAVMASGRAEPLIATAWMRELSRLIYADELGPKLMAANFDQRTPFVLDVLENRDGAGRWCANAVTGVATTCPELIARALTLALTDLERRYGSNQAHWTWGAAHNARSTHRPFGNAPLLRNVFDLRVPVGGDTYTLNVGRHDISDVAEPYTAIHGPSLRALYDLSDLENSLFMQSTGQSGIVSSALYSNFVKPWAQVAYISMRTVRADVEVGAMGVLRLVPSGGRPESGR